VGKHFHATCSSCKDVFLDRSVFGHHLIEAHGYTKKQLGWGLPSGWNKGKSQFEAFNIAAANVRHGSVEFMKRLNDPDFLKIKYKSRKYHEDVVVDKENELRAQGFRTFNTSNYSHHQRVPDIIAISSEGKVVAVEMESVRKYKSSIDSLRKKYTDLLMKEGFFDEVIVEPFVAPNFGAED
jgi:hypothetical protein